MTPPALFKIMSMWFLDLSITQGTYCTLDYLVVQMHIYVLAISLLDHPKYLRITSGLNAASKE